MNFDVAFEKLIGHEGAAHRRQPARGLTMWQALLPAVVSVIDKVLPDPQQAAEAKLRALELGQRGDLAQLDAEVRLALGQMEINKAEAQTDLFRGGWRPATGWCCVAGLPVHRPASAAVVRGAFRRDRAAPACHRQRNPARAAHRHVGPGRAAHI